MVILLSIVVLLLVVVPGAYFVYSAERGRPWALEMARAMDPLPPRRAVGETDLGAVDEPRLAA